MAGIVDPGNPDNFYEILCNPHKMGHEMDE